MVLARSSTYDLQQLVHILKIDPENVRIESPNEQKQIRLTQSKITSMMSRVKPASAASGNIQSSPSSSGPSSPATPVNFVVESKAMPLRAAKRKLSQEGSRSSSPKEPKCKTIVLTHNDSAVL